MPTALPFFWPTIADRYLLEHKKTRPFFRDRVAAGDTGAYDLPSGISCDDIVARL